MGNIKEKFKKVLLSFYTECAAVFLSGGILYCSFEMLWRSHTHITMFFAGGLCLLLIHLCEQRKKFQKFYLRCIMYAVMITAVELVFGIVFNIILKMSVWDYSNRPFNLWGQICPSFFLVWIALSLAAMAFSRGISFLFNNMRKQFA